MGGVDISYIKIPFYDAAAEKLSHGTKINLGLGKVQCPEYLLLKIISIFYLVQYAIYGFCNMVTKVSKSRCV